MTNHNDTLRRVYIAGDMVTDVFIYAGTKQRQQRGRTGTRVKRVVGGVGWIARLFKDWDNQKWDDKQVKVQLQAELDDVLPLENAEDCTGPDLKLKPFVYYLFSQFREEAVTWRYKPGDLPGGELGFGEGNDKCTPPRSWANLNDFDVLVLYDIDLGFRDWTPTWSPLQTCPWLVLRTVWPLPFNYPLGESLKQFKNVELAVAVVSLAELRHANVQISEAYSWEETLEELTKELKGGSLDDLAGQFDHLVIEIGGEGTPCV